VRRAAAKLAGADPVDTEVTNSATGRRRVETLAHVAPDVKFAE
jgi:hypothetical protein